MTEFFNLVIAGLVTGALYAILASGLTLTYQTSGVFNFGQGGIAFATAYLYFQLNTGQGLPIVPSAILSIGVFAPLLGWLLHRVLFNPLRDASIATRMVATLGLLLALPAAALWITEVLRDKADLDLPALEDVFSIPGLGPTPRERYSITDGLSVSSDQLAMLGAALFSALGLWLLVRHTRVGLEMRASVSRPAIAALRGVDPDRASAVSWVTSCLLAGLVGVLLGPLFGLSQLSYHTLLFISIPAVVLGRFASIPIAMAGGLLLGVTQNLVEGYVEVDIVGFTTAVPFIILFVLLFFFGAERGRSAGTTLEEKAPADELVKVSPWRRRVQWGLATAALLVYTAWGATDFWAGVIAQGVATAVILTSFTVVTGIGGMISLAQVTFVLAGAFTAGNLISRDVPYLPALLAGVIVAAVVGAIVALPTRRLGGLPLAISTLALAYIGQNLLFQIRDISNGSNGWVFPAPNLGVVDLESPRWMVVFMLVLLGLTIWLVHALRTSSTGRAMLAVRSSDVGAQTNGIAVGQMKMLVFVISAAIAGFGGVLLATANGRVTATEFDPLIGLVWLATTITFSIRRPAGAVIAGLMAVLAPQAFENIPEPAYFMQVLFGLGAIGLARDSDGALAAIGRAGQKRRVRKAGTAGGPILATDPPAAAAHSAGAGATAPATTSERTGKPAVAEPSVAPTLRVRGLHAGYNDAEVLHGVDLTVLPGQAHALLGSNGAGKTTLCSAIGGLITPTRGVIELDGEDVTTTPAQRRRRDGIYLAPEGRGIFPDLSVEENLTVWLRAAAERDKVYEAFPSLARRRRQQAGALSGGEQQQLTLAPALVRPPKLLIADEPSLGLAPLVTEQIFAALRELQQQGTALLISEEKTRNALSIADYATFITVGNISWSGPTTELDTEVLAAAYLGSAPGGAEAAMAGVADSPATP